MDGPLGVRNNSTRANDCGWVAEGQVDGQRGCGDAGLQGGGRSAQAIVDWSDRGGWKYDLIIKLRC